MSVCVEGAASTELRRIAAKLAAARFFPGILCSDRFIIQREMKRANELAAILRRRRGHLRKWWFKEHARAFRHGCELRRQAKLKREDFTEKETILR